VSPRDRTRARSVGVDTGGTFTDFVAVVDGRLIALKLPSTPDAPERAVLEGLERVGATRGTRVRHGSTVATNALLERKGAAVALVTTSGFEDLIEIARQDRADLYALRTCARPCLVPSSRRVGVSERVGPDGVVWRPLKAGAIVRAARAVRASGASAVAIVLLHAYAHPEHERRVARALARLGAPLSVSSQLCPEVREYERLSTTVANAYLMPRVSSYLTRVARGTRARIEIVLSHGGSAPPDLAAREPVRQLLSGPAAGLEAARDVALRNGFRRALTLDVGGTSTDCAFFDGELPRRRAREVAGFPIQLPMLDVHTIGAGGGSIARVDAGGLLHVGPESAGASPGPAAYGRGGPTTLTDACVVLGRLPGATLAAGALNLDRDAAGRALEGLGVDLGLDSLSAAEGVVAVAEAHMAAALRRVSVERGHDPRDAALVAFGGAGGLHACALADSLECRVVLFPRHAGVLSAIGALTGASRRERSRSVLLDARDRDAVAREIARLEAAVRREFAPAERSRVRIERWAEVRYRGQSHELSIPVRGSIAERFHREHERRFGFEDRGRAVQVVTLEARGSVAGERAPRDRGTSSVSSALARARGRVRHRARWIAAKARDRDALRAGSRLRGPMVVLEEGATLWIPPRWSARLARDGTLVVRR
jgi:N-methylhydantoinase A